MKKNDYYSLDILKIIAALIVVSMHTEPLYYCKKEPVLELYDVLARCAVPIFFMLTGFFLSDKQHVEYGSQKLGMSIGIKSDDVDRQIKKIIRLYILWTAIYFPVTFIHGRRDGMPFTRFVLGFIKQLLFVGENYNSWHLWFLLAEVYALIILRILIRRLNNRVIITGIALTLWMFGNMFTDLCFRIDLLPPLLKTVMLFLRILFTDNGRLFTAFLYIWVGANLKDIILVFDKFLNKSVVMGIGIIGGFIRLIGNDIELIAAFGTLILSCSILILALFTNKYMPGKGYPIYLYLNP